MVSIRVAFALAALGLLGSGCYWSSPPSNPQGHQAFDVEKVPMLTVSPEPAKLASPRVILLARFDSVATQPLGGLYDFNDYEGSPLLRTYYFKHANLELFEHACDGLRATGLDIRKDYATTGEPALLEHPLRVLNPLVVRTRIVELQHDQVRTDSDPPTDNELVRLIVDVSVLDLQGGARYQARHTISGRLTWQEEQDVLRLLGLKLGEQLTKDQGFLRAIDAQQRGAS